MAVSRTTVVALAALALAVYAVWPANPNGASSSGAIAGVPGPGTAVAPAAPEIPIPVPGLTLKFRSGFEDGVAVSHAMHGRSSRLTGTDAGYDWGQLDHMFNYVAIGATLRGLVTTEIRTDRVRSGQRALYMRQNVVDGQSQNRLQFHGSDDVFGSEILTRRWYYLDDLARSLAKNLSDTSIGGTREFGVGGGQDFSLPVYIYNREGRLAWRIAGIDYGAGPYWSSWTRPPKGFIRDGRGAVPVGRWFLLDVYVKRHPTDGIVRAWVDGTLVMEAVGVRTKGPGARWFTKIADYDGDGPGHLWVDDVEIWGR